MAAAKRKRQVAQLQSQSVQAAGLMLLGTELGQLTKGPAGTFTGPRITGGNIRKGQYGDRYVGRTLRPFAARIAEQIAAHTGWTRSQFFKIPTFELVREYQEALETKTISRVGGMGATINRRRPTTPGRWKSLLPFDDYPILFILDLSGDAIINAFLGRRSA
jgi:hypothetical protein